ncbi:MAG: DUF2793 domain-containing protein [Pseudolabrys sp.]
MPTPRLALPYIVQGQAQKEITHNDALARLDAFVDLYILDRDLAAPPGAPADGDAYIVAGSPTGAWAGQAGNIAYCIDGAWRFYVPVKGLVAFIADEQKMIVFATSGWVDLVSVLAFQNLSKLGILTVADTTNRLAVKSDAVLLSHDDVSPGTGDMRVTLNKSAAGKDAGFIFQDAFSTRALFGLLGDDNFMVKVTPDGSTFHIGFSVDRSTGQMELPVAPKFSAYTNFDNYIAASTWTKVQFNSTDSNDQNTFDAGNNRFAAPFAGVYVLGFSLRFKANANVPTKVTVAFYKNGAELGRGRAVSGAPVDDVTTWNLTVLTSLAASDVIDVRVNFATNDGYVEADQSHFWGHYVP